MSSQPTSEVPVRITVSPSALPKPQERAAAGSGSRAWWGMGATSRSAGSFSCSEEAGAMTAFCPRDLRSQRTRGRTGDRRGAAPGRAVRARANAASCEF